MKGNREKRHFSFAITALVGSTVSNFLSICRGHKIEIRYFIRAVLSFLITLVLEIFIAWEELIWKKRIRNYQFKEPPVFIIGFWRSGTTLLHNLLCRDPEASYVTTFHTVFPQLVLSHKWLKKVTNNFLPATRPFDNVTWDMDSPQEEEFAIFNMQPYSFYKLFYFPNDYDDIFGREFFFDSLPKDIQEQWKEQYFKLVRKAILNTGGKRFIGKNPCSLGRISLLREMFPGARFIFIHRDPYKVVESLYGFIHAVLPGVQLQKPVNLPDRERVIRLYCDALRNYFRVRSMIDPANLVEIAYEDLMKDIPGTLRNIYSSLDLKGYDQTLADINSNPGLLTSLNRQPLIIPGETIRLLNQYAGDIMEKLGYTKQNP